MSGAYSGAPVFLSNPHMYGADPKYAALVPVCDTLPLPTCCSFINPLIVEPRRSWRRGHHCYWYRAKLGHQLIATHHLLYSCFSRSYSYSPIQFINIFILLGDSHTLFRRLATQFVYWPRQQQSQFVQHVCYQPFYADYIHTSSSLMKHFCSEVRKDVMYPIMFTREYGELTKKDADLVRVRPFPH